MTEAESASHPFLAGVGTALVTPFDDHGELDLGALTRLIERQAAAGIDFLVPCGTTGETPTLTRDEWLRVIETTEVASGGRLPVVAGAGSNSTRVACVLARAAVDAGAAATLQVAPYYNRPTQEGLVAHFTEVAEASERPVILYNIPSRCGVRIEAETLARLAEHPLIVAVKDATGDLDLASRTMQQAPDLVHLSGDDALTLPLMALGGRGVISVTSNVAPADMLALVRAATRGDLETARTQHHRLFPLFRALFLESNPSPLKAALEMCGLESSMTRKPLLPATPDTRVELRRVLTVLGLIPG